MKTDIKKVASAGLLSLALVVGVTGFAGASSGTIGTTGPKSNNKITHESRVDFDVDNDSDIDLSNHSSQHASSGDSKVKYNTTGGSAATGNTGNTNSVSATVHVDNSSAAAGAFDGVGGTKGGTNSSHSGSINNTGYDSNNEVKFENKVEVDVDNDTDVEIRNSSHQSAHSGDATVKYNTTGGSATTGSAMNTSSTSFNVRVTN